MTFAMVTVTLVFATCFNGASATCDVDGANCRTEPAAAPSRGEQGLSLFQSSASRSFVVSARAGESSKLQMSEPRSSFLLEEGMQEDIEDDFVIGTTVKQPPTASISDVADPAFHFRMCLRILIFLIIMDGVRRLRGTSTATGQPESQPRNDSSCAPVAQKPRRTDRQIAKDVAAASAALNEAIRASDVAQCSAILKDADPLLKRRILSEPDLWGCNALHLAAASGSAEIVSMLLESGGERVNAVDVWDQTPLHFAARAGSVMVCKILIDRGALLDAVDEQEYTALHVAAKLQHEATCEFLLDQGAGVRSMTDANIPPILSSLLVKRMVKQQLETPAGF